MTRRSLFQAAAALAIMSIFVCMSLGLWTRPLSMDNRLYFYIAERAASGVPPHVSAPDVKTQLAPLVDSASIAIGRVVGLDDVRSGRIGALLILIVGIWGVGTTVFALGATRAAAMLGALSVLAFSGMPGHVSVGFNPKILLFSLLAWGPYFVARGRFFTAGALASAAMCCWQPALIACACTALAALTAPHWRTALVRCIAGGLAAFALYEAYFTWHGVLAAQLFQNFALPAGSVHAGVDWVRGAEFVLFGSWQGIDRVAAAGSCFVLFLAGGIASRLDFEIWPSGRAPAPTPAVVLVLASGTLMSIFTAYEHQGEPDRFLLCAYFAIAVGVVSDRMLQLVRSRIDERAALYLQGALIAVLLFTSLRGTYPPPVRTDDLDAQIEVGRVVAMMAEAHGSVWSFGCVHLLALAHLTNHHPLAYFWDDLRSYVEEATFSPVVHERLPDVILSCRPVPDGKHLLKNYQVIRVPGLAAERARLFVRKATAPKAPRKLPPTWLLE